MSCLSLIVKLYLTMRKEQLILSLENPQRIEEAGECICSPHKPSLYNTTVSYTKL